MWEMNKKKLGRIDRPKFGAQFGGNEKSWDKLTKFGQFVPHFGNELSKVGTN